jgi:hypothetical protein
MKYLVLLFMITACSSLEGSKTVDDLTIHENGSAARSK